MDRHTWPVRIGLGGSPWVKAEALRSALSDSPAEIVVVADADCWTEGLGEAVAAVEMGAPWAVPHRGVYRLTEQASHDFMAGAELPGLATTQRPYLGIAGGGIVVAPRETLLEIPIDPRFVGWGQEDESWGLALRTLAGVPHRCRHPLVHLWHPPQPRLDRRWGSEASRKLAGRYTRAEGNPDAMRVLIEEAHEHLRALQSPDHDHSPIGA